jgi:hypothetical protein
MGLLSREDLLTKEKLEVEKVDLENDNFVYVRQMTGHERDLFEQSMLKKNRDGKGTVISYETVTEDFRAKLAVHTVCDENGELILKPTDYGVFSRSISSRTLEKIINVSNKLNGISEEDKENLIKNSKAVQDGNSNLEFVES